MGGTAAAGGERRTVSEPGSVGGGVDDGVGADLRSSPGHLDADVEVGSGVGATASADGGFEHDARMPVATSSVSTTRASWKVREFTR